MNRYEKMALGVDISHYQPVVDYSKLAKDFDFAIVRCGGGDGESDSKFAEHVQGCYDADIPAMAYYWFDPIPYFRWGLNNLPEPKDDPCLTHLKHLLQYKAIHVIFIDIEQWWADWGKYYDFLAKKIAGSDVPLVSPAWMQKTIDLFLNHIQDDPVLKNYPLIVYTAKHFTDRYQSVDVANQLSKYCIWVANYPAESYPPCTTHLKDRVELVNYLPKDTTNPVLFGTAQWSFWQFSGDRLTLPYITDTLKRPSGMDFNLYNGTKEKLYDWLGITVAPPVEPEPEPEPDPEEPGQDDDLKFTPEDRQMLREIWGMLDKIMAWFESF